MNKREELIENLTRDLAPVKPAPDVNRLALVWLLASAVFVLTVTNLVDAVRPGAYSQLAANPRFLLETLLGVVAIAWVGLLAFRSAIPGALTRNFAVAGLLLMALWLVQYLAGLVSPALEPSELGKRGYCYLETMIYSIPPMLAAVYLARRLYPLHYTRTAMSLALTSGMMPALYMQIACMYAPSHILPFHILPGLSMALAGAAIATLWRSQPAETVER
jgi:hypothetical protein